MRIRIIYQELEVGWTILDPNFLGRTVVRLLGVPVYRVHGPSKQDRLNTVSGQVFITV